MQKDFDTWNSKKKELNNHAFNDYVHAREVWWCSLGINIGFEQDGKHKFFERPVLVIRKFSNNAVLIIPLSSKPKKNIFSFNFIHEGMEFSALLSQIRLISTKRLSRKIYQMDPALFNQIHKVVRRLL